MTSEIETDVSPRIKVLQIMKKLISSGLKKMENCWLGKIWNQLEPIFTNF